ncbi:MAG: DUF6364 family protein [Ginsengibacter sp.]
MKATLNLRFEKSTIEAAKKYALMQGTSLSEIVESYLKKITGQAKKKKFVSDNLIGIIKEYKDYTNEEIREMYLTGKHNA